MRALTPFEYEVIAGGCPICGGNPQRFLENVLLSAASGITAGVFTLAVGMGPAYAVTGFFLGTVAGAIVTEKIFNPSEPLPIV